MSEYIGLVLAHVFWQRSRWQIRAGLLKFALCARKRVPCPGILTASQTRDSYIYYLLAANSAKKSADMALGRSMSARRSLGFAVLFCNFSGPFRCSMLVCAFFVTFVPLLGLIHTGLVCSRLLGSQAACEMHVNSAMAQTPMIYRNSWYCFIRELPSCVIVFW